MNTPNWLGKQLINSPKRINQLTVNNDNVLVEKGIYETRPVLYKLNKGELVSFHIPQKILEALKNKLTILVNKLGNQSSQLDNQSSQLGEEQETYNNFWN